MLRYLAAMGAEEKEVLRSEAAPPHPSSQTHIDTNHHDLKNQSHSLDTTGHNLAIWRIELFGVLTKQCLQQQRVQRRIEIFAVVCHMKN